MATGQREAARHHPGRWVDAEQRIVAAGGDVEHPVRGVESRLFDRDTDGDAVEHLVGGSVDYHYLGAGAVARVHAAVGGAVVEEVHAVRVGLDASDNPHRRVRGGGGINHRDRSTGHGGVQSLA